MGNLLAITNGEFAVSYSCLIKGIGFTCGIPTHSKQKMKRNGKIIEQKSNSVYKNIVPQLILNY